jgi:hypothetical protein
MSSPVVGTHDPKATADFLAWFGLDVDCRDDLEWLRWPGGFVCAVGGGGGWRLGDGRFMCAGCGARTSVTAGTVLDRTRTPVTVWFYACWMFATRGRRVRGGPAEGAGDRLLRGRLGGAAPAAPGLRTPGPRPSQREGRGRRDLHRWRGAWAARWAAGRQEGARRRRRATAAEGLRPHPHGRGCRCGGRDGAGLAGWPRRGWLYCGHGWLRLLRARPHRLQPRAHRRCQGGAAGRAPGSGAGQAMAAQHPSGPGGQRPPA